jgi:hypothetical protein
MAAARSQRVDDFLRPRPAVDVFTSGWRNVLRPDTEEHDMADSTEMQKLETQAAEGGASTAQAGCCGGAAPEGAGACCALDAEVKSAGGSGCGCAPKAVSSAPASKGCC